MSNASIVALVFLHKFLAKVCMFSEKLHVFVKHSIKCNYKKPKPESEVLVRFAIFIQIAICDSHGFAIAYRSRTLSSKRMTFLSLNAMRCRQILSQDLRPLKKTKALAILTRSLIVLIHVLEFLFKHLCFLIKQV
jgi:hypothetical protein